MRHVLLTLALAGLLGLAVAGCSKNGGCGTDGSVCNTEKTACCGTDGSCCKTE